MNFEELARALTLELGRISSMGKRRDRIREALCAAYRRGRADAGRALVDAGGSPPEAKPPIEFEVEGN